MTEFFHSQAFAFIIGCFIGGAIGFFVAALCAGSGRASRAEEEMIYKAAKREEQRRDELSSEDMVSRVKDILGRKVG